MEWQEFVKPFKFKVCNPPSCGCPEVEYDSGLISIVDDFGGKIKLTLKDLAFIAEKATNLINLAKEDAEKQQQAMLDEIAKKKRGA